MSAPSPTDERTGCSWLASRCRSRLVDLPEAGWRDAEWVELQLAVLVPSLSELIRHLMIALPPSANPSSVTSVVDFMSVTSRVSAELRRARPKTHVRPITREYFTVTVDGKHDVTPAGAIESESMHAWDADVITSVLGLQTRLQISGVPPDAMSRRVREWLVTFAENLLPGGHVFIAETTDAPVSIISVVQMMQSVGFVDVDVAWAADGMWLVGARRPTTASTAPSSTGSITPVAQPTHVRAPPSTVAQPAPAAGGAVYVESPSPPPHRSNVIYMDSSPSPPPPPESTAHPPIPMPSSSSTNSGPLPPNLLAKIPLLFARFDPSQSGLLTYHALRSLCRAVGRSLADEDGEDGLWWTYQSIASPDQESGQIGITIEDLTEHFYKSRMWDLQHDLEKLRLI
jgi:hypothetical protein